MSTYVDLPRPWRSEIIDPILGTPQRVIMHFNPDSLERSLAPQAAGTPDINRSRIP